MAQSGNMIGIRYPPKDRRTVNMRRWPTESVPFTSGSHSLIASLFQGIFQGIEQLGMKCSICDLIKVDGAFSITSN